MEKGYNSDIDVLGTAYHIQTEDWGRQNPYLVSRVFCNGAVLRSIKTEYSRVLPETATKNADAIRLAMRLQHEKVVELLRAGRLLSSGSNSI